MTDIDMGQTVYIIDELVSAPGKGKELLAAYQARYIPSAQARGMVLERILISPPVWLEESSNRLTISWTVEGAGGWWGQAVQSRYDPAVGAFWAEIEPLITARDRHFGAAEADIAELTHV
jgi:hypothetical protein